MSSDVQQKLLTFLAGEFARPNHQSVVRIDLTFRPPGGYRPDPLGTWTPDDGKSAELFGNRGHVFVERLVGEIIELAENHADSYGQGRHRFDVRATQHMGGRQLHSFVVAPSFDGDDQALAQAQLAEPSQANLVGQLMRHLENRDRQAQQERSSYLQAMAHYAQSLRDENISLREMLAKRDGERLESMKIVEEAKSEEHKRQIEAATVVADKDRKDFAVKKVFGLLPVAISQGLSHLAKKSKAAKNPDGTDAEEEVKEPTALAKAALRLMQSLKASQRDLIEDILTIEQRIMLAEIARVAAEGGSLILPALVHELASTLHPSQTKAILGCLEAKQVEMFVALLSLAAAQTAPPEEMAGTGTKANGTAAPPEAPTDATDAAAETTDA